MDQWFRSKRRVLGVCLLLVNAYTLWSWYAGYFGNDAIDDNGSVLVGMFTILPIYILILNVVAIYLYKFVIEYLFKVPKTKRKEDLSGVTALVKGAHESESV